MSGSGTPPVVAGTPAADHQSVTSSAAFTQPRREARHAARRAAEASAAAASLHNDTTQMLHAQRLQDLKLPCLPVSPLGSRMEAMRTVAADHVLPSPWCELPAVPTYTLPAPDTSRENLDAALESGLQALTLAGRPLSYDDATLLADVLTSSHGIKRLVLSDGALDASRAPGAPEKLIQDEADRLEAEVGPEEDEANVEKLQAMCDKAKIEFTGYEAALKALAARSFDRITALVAGLLKNYSIAHLDVARNGLGAPNAEGRSNYQTLRRLAVLVDDTKSLRSIDFSGNNMGPQGVGIVGKALTKNITIESANLSGNELMGEAPDEDEDPENEEGDPVFGELNQGLEALAEVLKKNKFLKVLALRNNRLKAEIEADGEDDGVDTALGKFLEPLKKYHRLEVLDLSSNELGPAGARMVAAALAPNQSVRALDISDNGIGLQGLSFIAKLLQENTTIASLHCQRNAVTWNKKSKKATKAAFDVFATFNDALSGNATLTELNLSGHHFGVDVCDTLLKDFAKSRVATLTFDSNNLCGDPDVAVPDTRALEHVIAAVKRPEHPLKVLRLASNRLLAGGVALLAAAVVPDVEELDLRRNMIGDEGLTALCEALSCPAADGRKCGLRILKLAFNTLRDATPLGDVLPMLQGLRHLDVGHNRLGSNSAAFGQMLSGIGNGNLLRDLVLASNALGTSPDHVDSIESLFRRAQPPLATLDLYDNPAVTLKDTLRLVNALTESASIRTVRISSQAGDRYQLAEAVAKLLQTNKSLTDLDLAIPHDLDDEDLLATIRHKLTMNALTGIVDISL